MSSDGTQNDVAGRIEINVGRRACRSRVDRQSRARVAQEDAARRRRGFDGSRRDFDLVAEAHLRCVQHDAGGGDVGAYGVRVDQVAACAQSDVLSGRNHPAGERQAAHGRDRNGAARRRGRGQHERLVVGDKQSAARSAVRRQGVDRGLERIAACADAAGRQQIEHVRGNIGVGEVSVQHSVGGVERGQNGCGDDLHGHVA